MRRRGGGCCSLITGLALGWGTLGLGLRTGEGTYLTGGAGGGAQEDGRDGKFLIIVVIAVAAVRGGGLGRGFRTYVSVARSMESTGGTPRGSRNTSEQNSTGCVRGRNIISYPHTSSSHIVVLIHEVSSLVVVIASVSPSCLTLVSDIQMGAVCCLSMRSTSFVYQLSEDRSNVAVNTWLHSFSSFWDCSRSFFEERWDFLKVGEEQIVPKLTNLTLSKSFRVV